MVKVARLTTINNTHYVSFRLRFLTSPKVYTDHYSLILVHGSLIVTYSRCPGTEQRPLLQGVTTDQPHLVK